MAKRRNCFLEGGGGGGGKRGGSVGGVGNLFVCVEVLRPSQPSRGNLTRAFARGCMQAFTLQCCRNKDLNQTDPDFPSFLLFCVSKGNLMDFI